MSRARAELVQPHHASDRAPILPGCWVVIADHDFTHPVQLGVVADGPRYGHMDGHAIGAVWTLADGHERSELDLTALDVDSVLNDAVHLLVDVRRCRAVPDVELLRVHRVACLARGALAAGWPDITIRSVLEAMVEIDWEISQSQDAVRDFMRRKLPNLVRSLYEAGALALARSPDWMPGDRFPCDPHPRWPGDQAKGKL